MTSDVCRHNVYVYVYIHQFCSQMLLALLQASAPDFFRTLCTSILIKAGTPTCPSCSPQLICAETSRCPDCICHGEVRSCPVAPEAPCPLLLTFTIGLLTGIIASLLVLAGLSRRRRSTYRTSKEPSSSSEGSDNFQPSVFKGRVKYGLGSR